MITIMILILMLTMMWIILNTMKLKKKMSLMSLNPFECGFNNYNLYMPLSIQFTLITFIFLIFDIELSILISSNVLFKPLNPPMIITLITFIMFMIISMMYELTKNSMQWVS